MNKEIGKAMNVTDGDKVDTLEFRGMGYRRTEGICAHAGGALTQRGRMAVEMVEKWGMVAAMPDGEDSAGRSKLRLSTPEELVARAVTTVDILWEQLVSAGWAVRVPSLAEMDEEIQRASNER